MGGLSRRERRRFLVRLAVLSACAVRNWFTRWYWRDYTKAKKRCPGSGGFEGAAVLMFAIGLLALAVAIVLLRPMFGVLATGAISMGILALGDPMAQDIDTR